MGIFATNLLFVCVSVSVCVLCLCVLHSACVYEKQEERKKKEGGRRKMDKKLKGKNVKSLKTNGITNAINFLMLTQISEGIIVPFANSVGCLSHRL